MEQAQTKINKKKNLSRQKPGRDRGDKRKDRFIDI